MTKYARYEVQGQVVYGIVEGNRVKQITKAPYEEYDITKRTNDLSEVNILAPVIPNKVVAIGLNYRSHLGERGAPKVPEPFFKTTSSVIGPGDNVIIPKDAIKEGVSVQPEAELSLVVGKRAKRVSKSDALGYVLGYTCGNDMSARDWQANDLQWWRAKSSDTFTPLGPYIVTDLDPSNLRLIGRINGRVVQDQVTSDLLYDVPTIIEFVTRVMTLEPGDVVMTGTPGRPDNIKEGDVMEVEVAEIGILRNPVINEE